MSRTEAVDLPVEARALVSEDVLAVVIGLVVFALALLAFAGTDWLGWVVTTVCLDRSVEGARPRSRRPMVRSAGGSVRRHLLSAADRADRGGGALGRDVLRFALAFTATFALAYASWFVGSWAYVAAVTPADQAKFGVGWSLKLTNEGGYIVALVVGLVIANFAPNFADWLKEAIRPELYIKIAIVILGAFVAVTAASRLSLASSVLLRGIGGDHRGLSDLLAGRLLHRAQMFRLQPGMGGAAGFRNIDLRRRGGDRDRRRDSRPSAGSRARLLAGRRLRRRRGAGPAVDRADLSSRTSLWSLPPGSGLRSRPTARRWRRAASRNRWFSRRTPPRASNIRRAGCSASPRR